MEQPDTQQPVVPSAAAGGNDASGQGILLARPAHSALAPQQCSTCGSVPAANFGLQGQAAWVYAIGRIEPRFPKISIEKEFAQVLGRDKTTGLTDRQALHAALSKPENRYLVRQLCWVMTIQAMETYILVPRDSADANLLVEALRPTPEPLDLDCVIGMRGPVARPEMCNGLMVPTVFFDQIYSFDRDSLIKAIPRPENTPEKDFVPAAKELFDRIMLITDNAGANDGHRALNYLAVRYPRIYEVSAEAFGRNESLTAVEVVTAPLSGVRKMIDVIFSFTHRSTDVVSKQAVRVDVTDEFPFLVKKLSPYYDH